MSEEQPAAQEGLRRILGLPTAILLVAGIMIGSGVFKKIVPMAQSLPNETLIIADVAHARLGPVRENWRNARAQNDPQKRRRISKRGIYGNHDG